MRGERGRGRAEIHANARDIAGSSSHLYICPWCCARSGEWCWHGPGPGGAPCSSCHRSAHRRDPHRTRHRHSQNSQYSALGTPRIPYRCPQYMFSLPHSAHSTSHMACFYLASSRTASDPRASAHGLSRLIRTSPSLYLSSFAAAARWSMYSSTLSYTSCARPLSRTVGRRPSPGSGSGLGAAGLFNIKVGDRLGSDGFSLTCSELSSQRSSIACARRGSGLHVRPSLMAAAAEPSPKTYSKPNHPLGGAWWVRVQCSAHHNSQSRGTGRGTTGGTLGQPRVLRNVTSVGFGVIFGLCSFSARIVTRTSISHRLWQREISPHRCPCCLGRVRGQRNAGLFLWLRAPRRAARGAASDGQRNHGGVVVASRACRAFSPGKGWFPSVRDPWTAGTGRIAGRGLTSRAPCRMPEAQLEPVAFARIATVHCSRSIFGQSRPSFRRVQCCGRRGVGAPPGGRG